MSNYLDSTEKKNVKGGGGVPTNLVIDLPIIRLYSLYYKISLYSASKFIPITLSKMIILCYISLS